MRFPEPPPHLPRGGEKKRRQVAALHSMHLIGIEITMIIDRFRV